MVLTLIKAVLSKFSKIWKALILMELYLKLLGVRTKNILRIALLVEMNAHQK